MERQRFAFIKDWLNSGQRKPLVLRGARQVGKTWLVRHLANVCGKDLIELNFEKNPQLFSLFTSNDPKQIVLNLSAALNKEVIPSNVLLFLDEIQAAPELLAKLRWFYEDMPELAVISAGSLLEFALEKHTFSMPVGRIQYMYLEPMSFEEFLLALEKDQLVSFLKNYHTRTQSSIPTALHDQFISLFKEYLIIGGLPAAVSAWKTERSLIQINQIHHDLMSTYRDDFAKYSGRLETQALDEVMLAISRMIGHKFIYSKASNANISTIKMALGMLNKAKICHPVRASAANGIPLGSEIKDKFFKEILLDAGLLSAILGLNLNTIDHIKDINLINQGAISDQIVGQMLRTNTPPYKEPELFYWLREEKGSNSEIDYVIEHGSRVIPIEVKSGKTGTLKSLHLFMGLKQLSLAIRVNSDIPSITQVAMKDSTGKQVNYQLLSIPFYLLSEMPRLIDEMKM